jgi:hypothetical protein
MEWAGWDWVDDDSLSVTVRVNGKEKADPPFGFAQGRLFGDGNQKGNGNSNGNGKEGVGGVEWLVCEPHLRAAMGSPQF